MRHPLHHHYFFHAQLWHGNLELQCMECGLARLVRSARSMKTSTPRKKAAVDNPSSHQSTLRLDDLCTPEQMGFGCWEVLPAHGLDMHATPTAAALADAVECRQGPEALAASAILEEIDDRHRCHPIAPPSR